MRMSACRLHADDEGVCLTPEIPDEEAAGRVLLSGFNAWGWHVLNNWYLDLSDEEYEWRAGLASEGRFQREDAEPSAGDGPPVVRQGLRS